jgi:hypothetical protein
VNSSSWTSWKLQLWCCQDWGKRRSSSFKTQGFGKIYDSYSNAIASNMSATAPDFTRYTAEVQQIFKAYDSHDDRTAHNNAIQVSPEVKRIFQSIGEQVQQQTPFEAKAQALSATIEIAEWILEDRGAIGRDIRQDLPWMPLNTTIRHVLDMLLPEELAAVQADGEIPKAIQNLRWIAKRYSLDLNINDSIDRLWLEESDQEDEAHMAL